MLQIIFIDDLAGLVPEDEGLDIVDRSVDLLCTANLKYALINTQENDLCIITMIMELLRLCMELLRLCMELLRLCMNSDTKPSGFLLQMFMVLTIVEEHLFIVKEWLILR